MKEVTAATTSASTYEFKVRGAVGVTVGAEGLIGGEAVDIQVNMGGTWVDVYNSDGTQQRITTSANPRYVVAPGKYRLDKPTTTNSVGLYADGEN